MSQLKCGLQYLTL